MDTKDKYTKEQLAAVRKIIKSKEDFYKILGVSKYASESDIKMQYKKLAIQIHPDKNKAPGATEAFRAILHAFLVLMDREKRFDYDLRESERHSNRFDYDSREFERHSRRFDCDSRAYERRSRRFQTNNNSSTYHQESEDTEYTEEDSVVIEPMQLLQWVTVFIIFCMAANSLFSPDPSSSLKRSDKHSSEKEKIFFEVPYYVKEDLDGDSSQKVGAEIEEDYITELRRSCVKQKSHKEAMIWEARKVDSEELLNAVLNMETSACEKLNDMYNSMNLKT